MKFWHVLALVALIFVVIGVYQAKVLGGVPVIGKYVSA